MQSTSNSKLILASDNYNELYINANDFFLPIFTKLQWHSTLSNNDQMVKVQSTQTLETTL